MAAGCFGEGARRGARGRGMVVVRWVGFGVDCCCAGETDGFVVVEVGGVLEGFVVVGGDAIFIVPVARTWSRILLDAGAAGVGCFAVVVAERFGTAAVAAGTIFCVPVLCAAFTGVVFAATGVGVAVRATGFGASFFAATVFGVRAGAFFSLTTFSLFVVAFVLAIFTPAGCCGIATVPAFSTTTFFGRPRFFTTGGSIVVIVDIATVQLIARR